VARADGIESMQKCSRQKLSYYNNKTQKEETSLKLQSVYYPVRRINTEKSRTKAEIYNR